MKYISHRIGNLELKRTRNIGTKEHYLEIVEWLKDDNNKNIKGHCYTILIFSKNKEGYFVESVLDRILVNEEMWKDLGTLIKIGFEFLKCQT